MFPAKKDNPDGLHQRYIVTKADGEPVDPEAIYFVLRLDGKGDDKLHIEACREAALAYADFVQSGQAKHLAKVGQELRNLVQLLINQER